MYTLRTLIAVSLCCGLSCAYISCRPPRRADIPTAVARAAAPDIIAAQQQLARIRNALSLEFTNREEAHARLEAYLRKTNKAEDRKSKHFLELWTAMSDITQQMESSENDRDMESFLKLAPASTLNEFVSLGIELLKLSEIDAAAVYTSAARYADILYRLEIANEAVPYIQESVNIGEMTVDEAKAFFKLACALDIDIEIVEAPK